MAKFAEVPSSALTVRARRHQGTHRRLSSPGSVDCVRPMSGENHKERLNRELIELLTELRVALLGVQVLFAFLLIVPFYQRFSSVTPLQRNVYFAVLLCAAVSAALLIAPSSHHRLLWRQGAKEATLRAANRLSVLGLTFLALAMIGAIFLITDVLFGGVVATVATVAIGAVFAWVWYGQPLLRLGD
jgi:membrane-associated HD superfamily phosphohydrolase